MAVILFTVSLESHWTSGVEALNLITVSPQIPKWELRHNVSICLTLLLLTTLIHNTQVQMLHSYRNLNENENSWEVRRNWEGWRLSTSCNACIKSWRAIKLKATNGPTRKQKLTHRQQYDDHQREMDKGAVKGVKFVVTEDLTSCGGTQCNTQRIYRRVVILKPV